MHPVSSFILNEFKDFCNVRKENICNLSNYFQIAFLCNKIKALFCPKSFYYLLYFVLSFNYIFLTRNPYWFAQVNLSNLSV